MGGWGAVIYRALTLSQQWDHGGRWWLCVCSRWAGGLPEIHEHARMVWAACSETLPCTDEHTSISVHTHTHTHTLLLCNTAGKLLLMQFCLCRFTQGTEEYENMFCSPACKYSYVLRFLNQDKSKTSWSKYVIIRGRLKKENLFCYAGVWTACYPIGLDAFKGLKGNLWIFTHHVSFP